MNDRASRAIHQAQAQRIQRYMQQRNPTAPPRTVRRPDGIDMSVQAHARDARRQVAERHRNHHRAQARSAARTGGQGRTSAQQRAQARQSTRTMQRER